MKALSNQGPASREKVYATHLFIPTGISSGYDGPSMGQCSMFNSVWVSLTQHFLFPRYFTCRHKCLGFSRTPNKQCIWFPLSILVITHVFDWGQQWPLTTIGLEAMQISCTWDRSLNAIFRFTHMFQFFPIFCELENPLIPSRTPIYLTCIKEAVKSRANC